jgi:hypothetical protein
MEAEDMAGDPQEGKEAVVEKERPRYSNGIGETGLILN